MIPLCLVMLMTAQDKPADILANVNRLLADGDSYRVVEYIQSQGDPARVARLYAGLLVHILQKEKNVDAFVRLSQAGIHYDLAAASLEKDKEKADALRAEAKALAYNLAANTWQGWGEGTFPATPAQVALGYDAAKLNLRLALELKKPAIKVAYGLWMLGAHQMSAGDHKEALASFESAAKKATEAKDEASALSSRGFHAVTRIVAGDKEAGHKALDEVKVKLAELAKAGNEDAKYYATQFDPALAAFAKN